MKTLFAYVPALHRGYLELFERYHGGMLYLLGDGFRKQFTSLERDVRAVSANRMQCAINGLEIFGNTDIIEPGGWEGFLNEHTHIAAPDEDVMHELLDPFIGKIEVTYEDWRLRWDKQLTLAERPVTPNCTLRESTFREEFMKLTEEESAKSADFWRQVGAVAARDGRFLFSAYNEHLPNDRAPYMNGDPRSNFNAGEFIEFSTALHAEAAIVAASSEKEVTLRGSDMYVTTFPCQNCARLLARAHVRRVFYRDGYSRLDAREILGDARVEVIHVAVEK